MQKSSAHYDTYDYRAYWKGRDYEHDCEAHAINTLLEKIHVQTLMDVGAGFGRLVPYYKKHTKKIILAEPSGELLKIAKDSYKKMGKTIEYIHSPVETLSKKVKPHSVDAIVMVRVMHHLKSPTEVMSLFSKTLKKDGYLLLEFANKIHIKALVKNICRGDFAFPLDLTPNDIRGVENKKKNSISFYNHHPETIFTSLKKEGFHIIETRSVSNIRSGLAKKYLPQSLLLFIERILQKPLAKVYFGPSLFILAQKKGK